MRLRSTTTPDTDLYNRQLYISQSSFCDTKLVLYIAPTGTGKKLTPIGLSHTSHTIIPIHLTRSSQWGSSLGTGRERVEGR